MTHRTRNVQLKINLTEEEKMLEAYNCKKNIANSGSSEHVFR